MTRTDRAALIAFGAFEALVALDLAWRYFLPVHDVIVRAYYRWRP